MQIHSSIAAATTRRFVWNSLPLAAWQWVVGMVAIGMLTACGGGGGGRAAGTPPTVAGDTFAITSSSRLINFERSSGRIASSVNISGLQGGDTLVGFDIRPRDNSLAALAASGRIYAINANSGAASVVVRLPAGMLDAGAAAFGVDFDPVADRLRIVTNTGQNLRVDLNVPDGAPIIDSTLTLNTDTLRGIAGAAYNNNFVNACRTQLFYLDTANNRLLTTTAPNDGNLSIVGVFGVAANASPSGFEFVTGADGSNTAVVVLTVGGAPTVYALNASSGAVNWAVPILGLAQGELIVGIAVPTPPSVVQASGELTGLTANSQLFTFNSAAPNKLCSGPTSIAGLDSGENVVGIDVRPADGELYGVGLAASGAARVFRIDRSTGAIGAVRTLTTGGTAFTVLGANFASSFNPVTDRLRLTSDGVNRNTLQINVGDGTATLDGSTTGDLAAAHTNGFGVMAPATTTLYTIDSAAGMLNIQDPVLGKPVPVGLLNLANTRIIGAVNGFDIDGANNLALAGLQLAGSSGTSLFGIDLQTGAATAFEGGAIGAGVQATPLVAGIRGFVFTRNPQVTVVGVTASGNQLINFPAGDLGNAAALTNITTLAITGLQSGETIMGADFRTSNNPALDNRLYVVTDQARTYVVNPETGAATQQIVLTANAGDSFAGFMGSQSFATDFIPSLDRLRTITGTHSVRSTLDGIPGATPGTTFTDASLTRVAPVGPQPVVTGAAYSNSTPGAPAPTVTRLFTIDQNNDVLAVQVSPGSGGQRVVGSLGVDVTEVGGFDITGTNTALAVLTTSAIAGGPVAVTNGLYSINLANGAARLIGPVVNAGGPITGMALPVAATDPPGGNTLVTAVVNGNTLIQFPSTAAGVAGPLTHVPINGLLPSPLTGLSDFLLDIDFRPSEAAAHSGMAATPASSGALYGFGRFSNVYIIAPATGAATGLPLMLDPNSPNPTTVTFFGFRAGIDFDPTTDSLRIVSDQNANLLTQVTSTTALARTESFVQALMPPPLNMIAAAYADAFPRPASLLPRAQVVPPMLYGIDGANSTFIRHDPTANATTLHQVGLMDSTFNFTSVGELDIAGGDNGLVLAALQRTGDTPGTTAAQSSLYRIDLTTGQAHLLGDIGSPTAPLLIRSLAIRVR